MNESSNECVSASAGSASKLTDDEMKKLIEGIDIDAISRRVAEHMADTSEKYRQACIVSAIENLNLHITALASCNSVVAGLARLKAEEDRRTLIGQLACKQNNEYPQPRAQKEQP